jgi:hypothetical protein
VIDVELCREEHSSIRRRLKPLNVRTELRTKLDGPVDLNLVMKKKRNVYKRRELGDRGLTAVSIELDCKQVVHSISHNKFFKICIFLGKKEKKTRY